MMNNRQDWWRRLATLVALVERAPGQVLGRTAVVKLLYLLQALRGVDLGYHFRLYTYGPYDADVLDDLAYARSLDAVTVRTVQYAAGYGYEIRPGIAAASVKAQAADWLKLQAPALDWVVAEFGHWAASELELGSTVVYVDRELAGGGTTATLDDLTKRVRQIKPHFEEAVIRNRANEMLGKRYLTCVTVPSRTDAVSDGPESNGKG
jgi:hypothetical protein